jgi:predicted AAA+ superfamily ATPase
MIKRELLSELIEHLEQKEISLIVGPRQAGKTTLMNLLKEVVTKKGKKSLYLNLDIEADKQYFVSQEQLLRKIRLDVGDTGYLFIDEIQRKENAGLFLKGLFDRNLPYKLIVSGSGSVELKEKIHESLAGRKRMFELSTLSWTEFVNFKTKYQYEDRLLEFFSLEVEKTQVLLEEYMSFGGYPRVVLEDRIQEKRKIMAELYQSYLVKDIVELLGVQKSNSFTALVRIMASQIGQMVNINELSSTLGIHKTTINQYLWYMEQTFLIEKVTPFFKNIRKEITKAPIYYFTDLGMRNYALGIFGNSIPMSEPGFLFQNFVFEIIKQLTRNSSMQIHYWRTMNKAEVDFVIDKVTDTIPVEVKYQNLTKPNLARSFQSFISNYQPKKAFVIHMGKETHVIENKTEVELMPFFKLAYQPI